ncbi:MAG: PAS domain S-box protein [Actinobacteria bacterium]|nr:PAS domain S-box protein [Actinomycetota bacterium]
MSQSPDFVLGDEFARVLTETTMSLVCVLDEEGRIMFFNEACERLTGFTRDDVLGRDAREVVIPREESEAFGEVLAYIWKTGLASPQVGHWMAKDGGRKLIAWSNKLMPRADVAPAILVTTGTDLSAPPEGVADESALEGDPEAKLHEIGRLAQEQRALRRVATLVASEASPERVFTAVSEECARVLEVNASAVFRYEGDDTATIVGRHSREGSPDAFTLGMRLPADENTGIGRVLRTGTPARLHGGRGRDGGQHASDGLPLERVGADRGGRDHVGPVGIASAEPLPARNLHDGAQQRLVSLALTIRLARRQLESDAGAAAASLEGAANELNLALAELRELARGLHPAALTEQGLGPALTAAVQRLPIEVDISAPADRLPENIEATVYYIALEALTNVAKHAEASQAKVTIRLDDEVLRFEVTDDGRGGADPSSGTGILGLRDRAEAVGGTLFVISPPGKGTLVTAQLPLSPA